MKEQSTDPVQRLPENQERATSEKTRPSLPSGVRSDVIANGRRIIDEDRELLKRLEEFDRGTRHEG